MKTGTEIGKDLVDAAVATSGYAQMRAGGNLGMAFIANAIATHADAMNRLAAAIECMAQKYGKETDDNVK